MPSVSCEARVYSSKYYVCTDIYEDSEQRGLTIFPVYSMCCAYISGGNRITFWSFRREDAIGPTSGSISPVGSSRKTSQQCQQSHTAPVTCLDISRDGLMAVTGLFLTCCDTKLHVLTFGNFLNMLFNNSIVNC